jgi:hypothetical protein
VGKAGAGVEEAAEASYLVLAGVLVALGACGYFLAGSLQGVTNKMN